MLWERDFVRVVAAAIFVIAFGVYMATLAPAVFLIDSGSLTVAAWSHGSAHPPGFPLFLMFTHLATLLPFGTIAWRANLASAFFAALAASGAAVVVAEILLAGMTTRQAGRRKVTRAVPSPAVIAPAMAAAGLLLAFSRTLWAYATVTEVYALNTFLSCALLALALRWRRTRAPRLLFIGAVVAGAALGVHYVTTAFVLAGVLLLLIKSGGVALLRSKSFAAAILIGALTAMAVYAYLPLAARGNPALNWGDPDNPRDFIRHVTAKEYRSYVTSEERGDQLGDLGRLVARELGPGLFPAALLLAAIGVAASIRRDPTLFWMWAVIGIATMVWFNLYPILDDEDSYLLPLFVVLATAAGYGAAVMTRERAAYAWVIVAIPAIAMFAHWRDRDRSDFQVGMDYAHNTLRGIEQDAILLTNDGHLWSALTYLRETQNVRRDVVPVHYGLLIRSWYLDQLVAREPALMASVRKEVAAYRPLVEVFENDEKRWQGEARIRDEFVKRLGDLVVAFVSAQAARGAHAYATPDVALKEAGIESLHMQRMKASFDVVPGGLAMQLLPRRSMRDLPPIRSVAFELRGLDDPRVRRTGGEVVERDIVPAYVAALRIRGRYQAFQRQFDEARRSYDDALRLDPANAAIRAERRQLEQFLAR